MISPEPNGVYEQKMTVVINGVAVTFTTVNTATGLITWPSVTVHSTDQKGQPYFRRAAVPPMVWSVPVTQDDEMYERFTDRARKVMQLANQEAQRFNHEYISPSRMCSG